MNLTEVSVDFHCLSLTDSQISLYCTALCEICGHGSIPVDRADPRQRKKSDKARPIFKSEDNHPHTFDAMPALVGGNLKDRNQGTAQTWLARDEAAYKVAERIEKYTQRHRPMILTLNQMKTANSENEKAMIALAARDLDNELDYDSEELSALYRSIMLQDPLVYFAAMLHGRGALIPETKYSKRNSGLSWVVEVYKIYSKNWALLNAAHSIFKGGTLDIHSGAEHQTRRIGAKSFQAQNPTWRLTYSPEDIAEAVKYIQLKKV